MVYQQLNQCGLAGWAVGKPPLWFLVACVVYVFNVYACCQLLLQWHTGAMNCKEVLFIGDGFAIDQSDSLLLHTYIFLGMLGSEMSNPVKSICTPGHTIWDVELMLFELCSNVNFTFESRWQSWDQINIVSVLVFCCSHSPPTPISHDQAK